MKYLFSYWKRVERVLKNCPHILLLSDYDGTLSRIVPDPKKAILDKPTRHVLKLLSNKRKRLSVSIVSGRRLSDVKRLIGLDNIYYAGNHGLEIKGPGLKYLHPSLAKFRTYIYRIAKELSSGTGRMKGAIVEYKKESLSLHYRRVKKEDLKRLKKIFDASTAPYLRKRKIKVFSGKKVYEVRPPIKWNKGDAAGMILKSLKKKHPFPVYIGDDTTDEDAFGYLKKRRSITVFVGKKRKSKAKYYLRSPVEVGKFLVRLCRI
ncbi:MAG: trehalose-phosphatase [Candidatus Omnitrophica bacterium]|nr:trehalose-phosphatase [Candidatus Omnitrophota bacterium]